MTQQQNQTSIPSFAGTWDIDPAHSEVAFRVKHLMIATVKGRFKSFRGTLVADGTGLAGARLEGEVDTASIDTNVADRDAHLRSADFFDAEAHPRLNFVGKHVEALGGDEYRVLGDLTIRGITKEVAVDVTHEGGAIDPWGNERHVFTATAKIDRSAFGLTWNAVLETGGVVVGDKVTIEVSAQVVKRKDA